MATVLKLVEDGTDAVDFTTSSSDYALRPNGLTLGFPEVARAVGGDPMLGEGQRLIERRYGNREISITFNIKAADHGDLVSDMRAINRLLDAALKNAREGLGKKIALHYKLDDANDEVVFDILDGEFVPGQMADPTVRRGSHLRECVLTLICEPYARLASPVMLQNLLANGGFEIAAAGESASSRYAIDLSTETTKYLSRGACTGLYGMPLAVGLWVDWPTQQSAVAILMQAGDAGVNEQAYRLSIDATNKVTFFWRDTTDAVHTVVDSTALTTGKHFIGVCIYKMGTTLVTVLMVDEVIVDTDKTSGQTLKTPTGGFYIGRDATAQYHFNGKVSQPFVIVGGNGITPFQLDYIRKWGTYGLYNDEPNLPSQGYWGLAQSDLGGIWTMHDLGTTTVVDKSGNARSLTVNGSPNWVELHPAPSGWLKGTDYETQAKLDHGLSSIAKHGCRGMRFKADQGSGAFNIHHYFTIVPGVHTLVFWLYTAVPAAASVDVRLGQTGGLKVDGDGAGSWQQFIWTKTLAANDNLAVFSWGTGVGIDVVIDSVEVLPGAPFGTYATPTEVTSDPVPYIGYTNVRNWPAAEKVNFLDIYDVPGDAPATCRLFVKHTTPSQELGPLRIGAQFGGDPWKFVNEFRACHAIFDSTAAYDTGDDPDAILTLVTPTSVVPILRLPLPALFPWLAEQHGSFKLFIGGHQNSSSTAIIVLGMLETELSQSLLTGDPQTDDSDVLTEMHAWDGGILSWPPAAAYARIREGEVAGVERYAGSHKPALCVTGRGATSTTADVAYIWLVPIDGGNFTFQPFSEDAASMLQEDELLVVDTIDEDAASVGYVAKELVLPSTTRIEPLLSAAGLSMHGTGFFIPPNEPGHFLFLSGRKGAAADYIFGRMVESDTLEVSLEYMPRFLYV